MSLIASSLSDSNKNITAEKCYTNNEYQTSLFQVKCAFEFLFNLSTQLKESIIRNYKHEVENDIDHQMNKIIQTNNGSIIKTNMMTPPEIGSISKPHNEYDSGNQIAHIACELLDFIEKHKECKDACLKIQIKHTFELNCKDNMNHLQCESYMNKINMGLNSGGIENLIELDLKPVCKLANDHSFIVQTVIEVVDNFRQFLKKQRIQTSPNHISQPQQPLQLQSQQQVSSPTPSIFKTDRNRFYYKISASARGEFIIQSIIVYFLRTAEQRLQYLIKESTS